MWARPALRRFMLPYVGWKFLSIVVVIATLPVTVPVVAVLFLLRLLSMIEEWADRNLYWSKWLGIDWVSGRVKAVIADARAADDSL